MDQETHGRPRRVRDDPAAIGRDPDAFEEFYRTHVEAVQRFIVRRVTDPTSPPT